MAQISRPFQIALAVVAVLGLVWVFALNRHSGSHSTATSTSAPSSAPSAPGVDGLTHAIAKAHGAVATSQSNAKQLQEKSAQASSSTSSGSAGQANSASSSASSPSTSSKTTSSSAHSSAPARSSHKVAPAPHGAATAKVSRQKTVETELKQGRIVALLFWNRKGADDMADHLELQLLGKVHQKIHPLRNKPVVRRLLKAFGLELDKPIAIHEAPASQVASFGSITRGIQVYGTPTILIVDKHGKTITLTGLQDAYAIEQAIDEARHA